MCRGMTCASWSPKKGDRVYLAGLYHTPLGNLKVARAARDGTWADVVFPEGNVVRLPTPHAGPGHSLDYCHLRGRPGVAPPGPRFP